MVIKSSPFSISCISSPLCRLEASGYRKSWVCFLESSFRLARTAAVACWMPISAAMAPISTFVRFNCQRFMAILLFSLIIKKALHLTGNAKPFLDFPSNGICNAFQINLWKKRKWSDCGTIPPDAVLRKGNVHKLLR